jgi:molybdate transport system substrate-binding protein
VTLLGTLANCSQPEARSSATVAVATNFKPTFEQLVTDFESRTGYEIETVSGSTGKLYAQIIHGAPYDIFLAADQTRPKKLVQDGHAAMPDRFTYAIGSLALWSRHETDITPDSLIDPGMKRLALANPDLAPYGLAARQLLDRLDLTETLRSKFVFGESVGQTFAFVSTGNADMGFVSAAQVLALPEGARGSYWLVPRQLHGSIAQDAVLLERSKSNQAALAFFAFLKSPEAQETIRLSGYHTE